ncbi:MAG: T9SS type A sorting domain-containing protein [Phaeodactylibacter sp.]|nr:T9SS type A sorting domain-containing protein [Phaeodactylibacter sp.]
MPPRDSVFPFGRTYSVAVDENLLVSNVELLWADQVMLTDSSRLIHTSFYGDTLEMQDTFYVAIGEGSNLLLQEIEFENNSRIKLKQWPSVYHCGYHISHAITEGDMVYFCGEYSGNEGGMLLDGHFLDIGSGNPQGFIGMMDETLEVQWLRSVGGSGYEIENKFAINGNNKILLAGASASSTVHFCQDSLVNQAVFHWGTDFLYFVQFDTSGNCINKKTIDYYYGGTIPTSIASLSDNAYVVSGYYNPSYIGFDSLYLFNPDNSKTGFLVKLSDNLEAQAVFQLEGSPGPKYILSMITTPDGLIGICGYAQVDTLRIGNEVMIDDPETFSFGFVAFLDTAFNVVSAVQLDGTCRKLIQGQDGNIYLLAFYGNHHKLFKLSDVVNGIDRDTFTENTIDVNIFPNPMSKGEAIRYELKSANSIISHIKVYDVYGRRLISRAVNNKRGTLELDSAKNILFIEFYTNNNQRILKKIVAQ